MILSTIFHIYARFVQHESDVNHEHDHGHGAGGHHHDHHKYNFCRVHGEKAVDYAIDFLKRNLSISIDRETHEDEDD